MNKIYRVLLGIFASGLFFNHAWAVSFIVRQIRVEGLQGLSKGTVLNYMPISVGDHFDDAKSGQIIEALYGSGFFSNVKLARQGNTLIVKVIERPVIGSIQVQGNKAIKQDDIKKALSNAGLTVGNVFSQADLLAIKHSLQANYQSMGYYNTQVDTQMRALPRNRVAVTITISEGKVAKIQAINFVGNQAFSAAKLRKQLVISTPKLWSFITKDDQYSKQKLEASLEQLRSFYMDHGYLQFRVVSSQASLSPAKDSVIITIQVSEGPQFHFSGYTISGRSILSEQDLKKLITIVPGQIFSQKVVEQSSQAVALALGDKGYAFAHIDPQPTIDKKNNQVFINFHVNPEARVYVRRVIFNGNTVTADYVLRRAMQQMEGGLLSVRKVRESVRQLNLLGYFKNVDVKTVPVPGANNQVDLVYDVQEQAAGQATFSIGYGTLGLEYGAGINQPNFLGTGKSIGLNFNRSSYATTYSINYYNPYYTINNIGRGFSLFYTQTRPGDLNLTGSYATDSYGAAVNFNIPLSLNGSLTAGLGYQHLRLKLYGCAPGSTGCTPVSTQVTTFVNNNGTRFDLVTSTLGYNYSSLDKAIFPTKGFTSSLNAEVGLPAFARRQQYYKLSADTSYYLPLNSSRSFVMKFRGGVGYGNGYGRTQMLPFFFNYYAGGLAQGLVRGFSTNTLGPKDSNGDPIGGNLMLNYGAELIFPNYISPDTLRTSVFMDAGNVYQTVKNVYGTNNLYSSGAGPMRYAAGLAAQWRSPLGLIVVSVAKPINKQPGDDSEIFQFSMGTSF